MLTFALLGGGVIAAVVLGGLLLNAVLGTGQVWLTVVAVMFSLIGAFYYLRIVKTMWFDEPTDSAPLDAPADMKLVLSLNGVAILALGVLPGPLLAACAAAMKATLAT